MTVYVVTAHSALLAASWVKLVTVFLEAAEAEARALAHTYGRVTITAGELNDKGVRVVGEYT